MHVRVADLGLEPEIVGELVAQAGERLIAILADQGHVVGTKIVVAGRADQRGLHDGAAARVQPAERTAGGTGGDDTGRITLRQQVARRVPGRRISQHTVRERQVLGIGALARVVLEAEDHLRGFRETPAPERADTRLGLARVSDHVVLGARLESLEVVARQMRSGTLMHPPGLSRCATTRAPRRCRARMCRGALASWGAPTRRH